MKDQPQIGHYQAVFLITAISLSGLPLLYAIDNQLGRQQWLSLIMPLIGGILLYYCSGWLAKCLHRQTLDIVYTTLFGKFSGKLLASYFLLFYLFLAAYFMVTGINLWATLSLPNTPLFALIAVVLLTCLLISRLGLEVIARCGMLFIVIFLTLGIIDTAFLIPQMRFERLLPLVIPDLQNWLPVSAKTLILLFAPLPLTLHFLPLVNEQHRLKSSLGIGLLLALAFIVIITFRNIFVFGDTLIFENYATIKALRLVEWGNGVSRLELLSLSATLSIIFLAGAYMLLTSSKLLATISGLKSNFCHYLLVIALGFLMYILGSNNSYIDISTAIAIIGLTSFIAFLLLIISALKLKSSCKQ